MSHVHVSTQTDADNRTAGYLDHASVWPLRSAARQAWSDAHDLVLGDPARAHGPGRRARDLLDRASHATANALGAGDDAVVWTASGTEAIHLAVLGSARAAQRRGIRRNRIVVGAVEHSAVLAAVRRLGTEHGFTIDVAPVDGSGTVDLAFLERTIGADTLSVHVQHANHEIGTLQPTHDVAALCRRAGALLHVDACQTVGQLGVTLAQLGADLLSASAAKFGGPPGTGFLLVGERGRIDALNEGDDRQRRRRSGLEDVAGAAATAVALQLAIEELADTFRARELVRRHLRTTIPARVDDVQIHGPLADAHPGILALSALYVDGAALVAELDARGYAVHSGSSCATATGEPSHVLTAVGALTHGHVRVSPGPGTTIAEIDRFVDAYADVVAQLRRAVRR